MLEIFPLTTLNKDWYNNILVEEKHATFIPNGHARECRTVTCKNLISCSSLDNYENVSR